MSWSRRFDEPIPVPKGRRLVTLRDAGDYIAKLPKAKYLTAEWQAAMFALILVVDLNGPAKAKEGPMTTVWIYVDTNKDVGDVDHLKVFATSELAEELADEWFKENDPEGAAFGYEVIEE
jgi:hypothetical protein